MRRPPPPWQRRVSEAHSVSSTKRILDAAVALGGRGTRIRIADLKRELPDIPSEEINKALLDLQRQDRLVLMRIDDPTDIRPADKQAAITIAGNPRHIIYVTESEARRERAPESPSSLDLGDLHAQRLSVGFSKPMRAPTETWVVHGDIVSASKRAVGKRLADVRNGGAYMRPAVSVLLTEANPRPQSKGFIVINTRTGEILSDLFKRREGARDALAAILDQNASSSPQPDYVEYRGGKWYLSLGVHQVMLYPGETYSPETYRP